MRELLTAIIVVASLILFMAYAKADHLVRKGLGGNIVYDRVISPEKSMLVTAELWAKELAVVGDEALSVAEQPWQRQMAGEVQARALALAYAARKVRDAPHGSARVAARIELMKVLEQVENAEQSPQRKHWGSAPWDGVWR
ncbi:MAG: hypothetical protein IPO08_21985 [Xanthomonadales bacterium]|nr:hypothetical protein [Xanthomonadales bacterium]